MKLVLSLLLVFTYLINLTSCQNPYRRPGQSVSKIQNYISPSSGERSDSTDAYRVDSKQYDQFFVMRYGLLYQKHSDVPFTGRIVQVTDGSEGKYVSSDDNWSNGKKHGQSTKWFSNGTKMYERNYKDGKWHGAVTRWWPNGQRMYVTAYTEGVRNSREAKWKSDGTSLNVSTDQNNDEQVLDSGGNTITEENINETPKMEFPSVDISLPPETMTPSIGDTINSDVPSFRSEVVMPDVEEQKNQIPATPLPDIAVEVDSSTDSEFITAPVLPELNENSPNIGSNPNELPSIPELPMDTTDSSEPTLSDLPILPVASDSNEATPSLPVLPELVEPATSNESSTDELPALPELPMDSSDASGETSPELPGLPPLPGSSSDSIDLPPLPPLP